MKTNIVWLVGYSIPTWLVGALAIVLWSNGLKRMGRGGIPLRPWILWTAMLATPPVSYLLLGKYVADIIALYGYGIAFIIGLIAWVASFSNQSEANGKSNETVDEQNGKQK